MRVESTGPLTYLTGQSRKVTGQTCLDMYLRRLVGPWSLVLFPGCRALVFFYGIVCSFVCVERAKNEEDHNPHTHIFLVVPVALDPRVDPTSELL